MSDERDRDIPVNPRLDLFNRGESERLSSFFGRPSSGTLAIGFMGTVTVYVPRRLTRSARDVRRPSVVGLFFHVISG